MTNEKDQIEKIIKNIEADIFNYTKKLNEANLSLKIYKHEIQRMKDIRRIN